MTRQLTTGLALLAVLATACTTDPSGPNRDRQPISGPALAGEAETAAIIEAQLTCLYDFGLLPDAQSSLGKFDKIKKMWARGDEAGAREATAKLVDFINLKYGQYEAGGGDLDQSSNCGEPGDPYYDWTLRELRDGRLGDDGLIIDGVVANLWSFVGLEGNVCALPANNDASFCQTQEAEGGFVYFPPNIFANLSYVAVQLQPKTPLQLIFDEYPNQIEITIIQSDGTIGGDFTDDNLYPDKPIVVVCFNNDPLFTPTESIWGRLQLITRHNGVAKFLPKAPYLQVVQDYAETLCDPPVSQPSALAVFGRQLADWLLPRPLMAQFGNLYAFGGVGGSAEEFSPFTIGDPGLDAFGGVGGSAEEFAPPMLPSGPMGVNGYDPTDPALLNGTWFGQIGDGDVTTNLPGVTVTTQPRVGGVGAVCTPDGSGTDDCFGHPVNGVVVRFTLKDADDQTAYPASTADLCGTTVVRPAGDDPYVEVATGSTGTAGRADLPCFDFGNTLGFKKLRVTFDPSPVDPEACMFSSQGTGECLTDAHRNFLMETVEGEPSALSVSPTTASGAAGSAFDFAVQVRDQNGNPITPLPGETTVPTFDVTVTASTGYTLGGPSCAGSPAVCSATTDNLTGAASFTGLTVGGLLGEVTLTFAATGLSSAVATVTLDAADDASTLELVTAPVAGQLAKAFSTSPVVKVTDQWGNPVPRAAVAVSLSSGGGTLACVAQATGCDTGFTSADGQFTFGNLTITNLSPISSQTLHFSSAGTTCTGTTDAHCAATVTPSPGDPALLAAVEPTTWTVAAGQSVTPTVKLTDVYLNPISGKSIAWTGGSAFGGSVSPASSTTGGTGQASTTWTLGDEPSGGTTLTATYTGLTTVVFTATTSPFTVAPLECVLGSNTKKLDLGNYNPTTGKYTAWFTFTPELAARITGFSLQMSMTGQSSGTGDYPVEIWIYRQSGTNLEAVELAHGTTAQTSLGSGLLKLPGDNGTPTAVTFPVIATAATIAANTNTVNVKLTIQTNDASRTPQVWYNNANKPTSSYCGNSVGYANGKTPATATNREKIREIANRFEH